MMENVKPVLLGNTVVLPDRVVAKIVNLNTDHRLVRQPRILVCFVQSVGLALERGGGAVDALQEK
jgi:hypothetical protein